ncbi:MAG TPA: hypothetical protein VK974_04730 [Methylophilaceae bacterium]|nr:hypothetical protein [Methylophilaceae bacterium]
MILSVIDALKQRLPETFAGRISGAAEFALLDPAAKMDLPAAYVIPLDDRAEANESSNGYQQLIRDAFGVVVVLDNAVDEKGNASILNIIPLRNKLFAALLSWQPDEDHGPIEYEGGQTLDIDRARFYYQFEFSAQTEITEADTYQAIVNAGLGPFETLHIDIDMISPHNTNLGSTGPDGTIDAALTIDVPQT